MKRWKRLLRKLKRKTLFPLIKIINRQKFDRAFYQFLRQGGVVMPEEPYFISDDVFLDDVGWDKITIEKDVTISKGVSILIHDFSISKPIELNESNVRRAYLIAPVYLKEGCFIGANTMILPGTIVGKNTIVGAGSVIKGNIPDNVVIAGNPAKVIRTIDEYYQRIKGMPTDSVYRV